MRWSNISVESFFYIIYYCLYFSCFECLCAGPFYYFSFFLSSPQSVKGTMRQKCSLPLRSENGTFFKKLAFSLHFFSDFLTSLPKCVLQFLGVFFSFTMFLEVLFPFFYFLYCSFSRTFYSRSVRYFSDLGRIKQIAKFFLFSRDHRKDVVTKMG